MENQVIKDRIAAYWDELGDTYDSYPRHGLMSEKEEVAWIRFLKEILPENTGLVLDVGAGTGFLSLLLAGMGLQVKSTDLSAGMQASAARKAEEAGLGDRIMFAIEDAEALDEADDCYDAVLNRHLLWTLPHPAEAVREWLRVTRPGGRVVIIDADWNQDSSHVNTDSIHDDPEKNTNDSSYEKDLEQELPLMDGRVSAGELLRSSGFPVKEYDMCSVEEAERQMIEAGHFENVNMCRRFAFVIEKT